MLSVNMLFKLTIWNFTGENNTFLISLSSVLFLLLLLLAIGVVCFICKIKRSHRNAVKKDVNPLYGVDYEYEMEEPNKKQREYSDNNYDYMG